MRTEKYQQDAKQILETDGAVGVNLGANTPINSRKLRHMPRGSSVTINESVYHQMDELAKISRTKQEEYSFFLFGEANGQEIFFDNIVAQGNEGNAAEAGFTQIAPILQNFVNEIQRENIKDQIVCHGHSHHISYFNGTGFSLGDMGAYMEMNQENKVFKNKDIELCSCVLENGDFNFLFYDNQTNNFYKFDDVRVKKENGQITKLPCYREKDY